MTSGTNDWRKPFLDLKAELRPLYDASLRIHHGVVLSANRSAAELRPAFEMLEPAYANKNLVKTVEVETDGCTFHGHFFFADDRRGLNQLGRVLDRVGAWLEQVPEEILPRIRVPVLPSQTNRNLVQWVSAVYAIAWELDEVYLQAELEYLKSAQTLPFLPWIECPQPSGCDPRPWMIHEGDGTGRIPQWLEAFTREGLTFPDLLSAYLLEDLVASSLAAIDLLVYRMPQELAEAESEPERQDSSRTRISRHQGKNALADRATLLAYLIVYHSSPEGKKHGPLKQVQLAERLGWLQPRVSRRMKLLFPGGMKGYVAAFANGIPKGFGKKGTFHGDFEAIADEDDEDDET